MKLLDICVFSLLLGATAGFLFQENEASIQPEDPYLVTGDDLRLKCSSSSLDPHLNASHMYFNNSLGNIPKDSTTILTNDTIQLLIINVTKQISVPYTCFLNESSIGGNERTYLHSTFVTVYDPPKQIENFECISQNFDSMTCSWCENEKDDYISTELHYKIQDIPSSPPRGCLRYDSVIPIQRCMCNFLLEVPSPDNDFKRFMTYNMTVVSRLKANLFPNTPEANATFIIVANDKIVRPNPVSNLTQHSVYSNSVTVSWKSPFTITFALIYELLVESQWPDDPPKRLNCTDTEVKLTGLLAATHYNISVRCVMADQGRYWSNYSSLTVVTKEDIPAIPPSMAAGSYRRVPCPGTETCDELHIYWAPPTYQKLTRGHIVSYILTSEGGPDEDRELVTVDGDKFQAALTIQKNTVYNISVAAATAVGLGPAYSFLVTNGRVPSPPVMNLVERSGGNVLFDWNQVFSSIALTGYTLLGCEELGSSGECKDDIWHIDIPPDMTEYTLAESGENDLYALTANSDLGSSGMPEDWICVYYDNQRPSGTRLTFPPDQPERGLMMTWTRLDCGVNGNKARVASYTISYRRLEDKDGVPVSQTVEHPTTSLEINGLLPYTNYSLTILATSVHSLESMLSAPVLTTTRESVPLSPDNVTVLAATSHTVSLQWSPTASPNGIMQAYHVLVKVDGNDFTAAKTTPEDTNTTVGDLYGFMTYTVEVLGENGAGLSQRSNPLEFTTPIAAPTEIRMTNVTVISLNYTLVVVWSAPYPAHGPLSYYIVHVNWTRHGEPDLVIVNETDGHFSMAIPCNDDGVYNVGVTVSAVNVDEDGKDFPGPPSIEKSVQVCKDSEETLWWLGIVIATVDLLICIVLYLLYQVCWFKIQRWLRKLPITVPPTNMVVENEYKSDGKETFEPNDYQTLGKSSNHKLSKRSSDRHVTNSDNLSGVRTQLSNEDFLQNHFPPQKTTLVTDKEADTNDISLAVHEASDDVVFDVAESGLQGSLPDMSTAAELGTAEPGGDGYAPAVEKKDLMLPSGLSAPIIFNNSSILTEPDQNLSSLVSGDAHRPESKILPSLGNVLPQTTGGKNVEEEEDGSPTGESSHVSLKMPVIVLNHADPVTEHTSQQLTFTDYSKESHMVGVSIPLVDAIFSEPNADESRGILPKINADLESPTI